MYIMDMSADDTCFSKSLENDHSLRNNLVKSMHCLCVVYAKFLASPRHIAISFP